MSATSLIQILEHLKISLIKLSNLRLNFDVPIIICQLPGSLILMFDSTLDIYTKAFVTEIH